MRHRLMILDRVCTVTLGADSPAGVGPGLACDASLRAISMLLLAGLGAGAGALVGLSAKAPGKGALVGAAVGVGVGTVAILSGAGCGGPTLSMR